MSKTIFNSPRYGLKTNTAPGNFELDEIQWSHNNFPIRPGMLPFKNTIREFKEEMVELINGDDKDL